MLSPTFVHFMPTTLTIMPIKPSSTETTMSARHVWMWTRWQKRKGGGRDSRVENRAVNDSDTAADMRESQGENQKK